jgi:hypothetical protein
MGFLRNFKLWLSPLRMADPDFDHGIHPGICLMDVEPNILFAVHEGCSFRR